MTPRGTIYHFAPGNKLYMDGERKMQILTAEGVTYRVPTVLQGLTALDPPSLAAGVQTAASFGLTGAELGDFCLASFSLQVQGVSLTAYVSAANQVTVVFLNHTAGAIDLASGTLRVMVFKK